MYYLVGEVGPADELADRRDLRHALGGHRVEEVEHGEEPLRLGADCSGVRGFAVLALVGEGAVGEDDAAHDGEHVRLEDERAVEEVGGVLVVREDVALLADADGGPHAEGLPDGAPAVVVVADAAADEAEVGRREAVVHVDVDRRERADVERGADVLPDVLEELRVEPVDALEDEEVVRGEGEALRRVVLALPALEVVLAVRDLLALEQLVDALAQELDVHGGDVLEVALALLVLRDLVEVLEVVVHLDERGAKAAHAELDAEALGKGSLI